MEIYIYNVYRSNYYLPQFVFNCIKITSQSIFTLIILEYFNESKSTWKISKNLSHDKITIYLVKYFVLSFFEFGLL